MCREPIRLAIIDPEYVSALNEVIAAGYPFDKLLGLLLVAETNRLHKLYINSP